MRSSTGTVARRSEVDCVEHSLFVRNPESLDPLDHSNKYLPLLSIFSLLTEKKFSFHFNNS